MATDGRTTLLTSSCSFLLKQGQPHIGRQQLNSIAPQISTFFNTELGISSHDP
jgi:hypothetical protein